MANFNYIVPNKQQPKLKEAISDEKKDMEGFCSNIQLTFNVFWNNFVN